ncbi:mandelate racemase/muconate lactonizing enzyme family protein [Tropicimonas sp. IMCC34011]|uniref:mandelate racemase/muconate lactonizing enzyme family protein n=1 Tax=Tropicimonas sp. IMCC34011 TaxID=2248759 RepID=UPI000E23E242|nr:mandelate racemase/muconate lactonizing enzyme family protein [Tropicimonas sp. IMCC34011]
MTIINAESWILRFPSNRLAAERADEEFELIGVTMTDSSGMQGTGWTFTSDYGGGAAIKALLDTVLLPRVVQREALEVRALNGELFHFTHRLGHGITSMAISAIDVALWDLHARLQGISVAKALGQVRNRVPCYGSGKASPSLPLEDLVETSADYIRDGLDAVKVRVGRDTSADPHRLAAVREAIGPSPKIMIDANERLGLEAALRLGRTLADHDIYWFEEPIYAHDLDGYRRLRAELPMAVAGGEHFHSRRTFFHFAGRDCLDILQPDLCFIGGFTEAMKVAELADGMGLAVAPHFMTVLHIHLAAATPRPSWLEFYPFMDDLLVHALQIEDGHIVVPDCLGHGVEFTEDAWKTWRAA